jgi:hypothetical protein
MNVAVPLLKKRCAMPLQGNFFADNRQYDRTR